MRLIAAFAITIVLSGFYRQVYQEARPRYRLEAKIQAGIPVQLSISDWQNSCTSLTVLPVGPPAVVTFVPV
jgi:hypothetical protein